MSLLGTSISCQDYWIYLLSNWDWNHSIRVSPPQPLTFTHPSFLHHTDTPLHQSNLDSITTLQYVVVQTVRQPAPLWSGQAGQEFIKPSPGMGSVPALCCVTHLFDSSSVKTFRSNECFPLWATKANMRGRKRNWGTSCLNIRTSTDLFLASEDVKEWKDAWFHSWFAYHFLSWKKLLTFTSPHSSREIYLKSLKR